MSGDMALQALIQLLVMPALIIVAAWKSREKSARRFWPGFGLLAVSLLAAPAILVKLGSGTHSEIWSFTLRSAALFSAPFIFSSFVGRLCRGLRSKLAFASVVGASYLFSAVVGAAFVFSERSLEWTRFESIEGGFALELPGVPDCDSARRTTETATWNGHACQIEVEPFFERSGGVAAYFLASHSIPPELRGLELAALLREFNAPEKKSPSALLAGFQEREAAPARNENIESTTTQEVLLAGVPAVQTHRRSTNRGTSGFEAFELRCVRDSRLYELGVYGGRADLASGWERMLGSFRFIEARAVPPQPE